MEKESSFKYGILLVRSGFVQSPLVRFCKYWKMDSTTEDYDSSKGWPWPKHYLCGILESGNYTDYDVKIILLKNSRQKIDRL